MACQWLSDRVAFTLLMFALAGLGACSRAEPPRAGGEASAQGAVRKAPPAFESPERFNPNSLPAPSCVPPPDVGMPGPLPLWGRDAQVIAGADDDHGLMTIDIHEPLKPLVRGELQLSGRVRQVQVDPGLAVSLVIDEIPVVDAAMTPPPATLGPVTRLVRFDASDPAAPRRVADVALEGEFWRMVQRGDTRWVMSAAVVQPLRTCDLDPGACYYVARSAMIITGYRFQQDQWQLTQRVELPMNMQAWATPEGFASFEALGPQGNDNGVLHFVRFESDDELAAPSSLMLSAAPAEVAPLSLDADQVRIFLRNRSTGSVQLASFDSTSGSPLWVVDDVGRAAGAGSYFTPDAVYLGDESMTGQARWVDHRERTMPIVTAFPAGVAQAVPLEDAGAVLGVGQTAGTLTFTLMGVAAGSMMVLDTRSIDVGTEVASVSRAAGRVLFSYHSADRSVRTGIVVASASQLTMLGPAATGYADEVIASDDVLYAPDGYGLNVAALGSQTSTRLSWSESVHFLTAGDYQAALVSPLGMLPRLRLVRGDERHEFEVSVGAERLVADDQRVLVLSTRPRTACEESQRDCSGYAPNVTIFELGDSPRMLAQIALPAAELGASGDDWQAELDWERGGVAGPLSFGGGRFVLTAELNASCRSQASCDALGVEARPAAEANVAFGGTRACGPGAGPSCQPTPVPVPTVYGTKRAQRFYLLDAAAPAPNLGPALESTLELNDSWFAPLRLSGSTILAARIERKFERGVAPSGNARFMLDRIVLNADGQLEKLAPINIPGYPIALLGGGSRLVVAEPSGEHQERATLHRLELQNDRAYIVQSEQLQARFAEIDVAFGFAFHLRREGSGCDGSTTLEPIALGNGDDDLHLLPGLELSGVNWTIATTIDRKLLLTGQFASSAVIEVQENGELRLERFVNDARPRSAP